MEGEHLYLLVGYHPHEKNDIIRVVFQDQVMYLRTSFRGAKTCKICFWSCSQILERT